MGQIEVKASHHNQLKKLNWGIRGVFFLFFLFYFICLWKLWTSLYTLRECQKLVLRDVWLCYLIIFMEIDMLLFLLQVIVTSSLAYVIECSNRIDCFSELNPQISSWNNTVAHTVSRNALVGVETDRPTCIRLDLQSTSSLHPNKESVSLEWRWWDDLSNTHKFSEGTERDRVKGEMKEIPWWGSHIYKPQAAFSHNDTNKKHCTLRSIAAHRFFIGVSISFTPLHPPIGVGKLTEGTHVLWLSSFFLMYMQFVTMLNLRGGFPLLLLLKNKEIDLRVLPCWLLPTLYQA